MPGSILKCIFLVDEKEAEETSLYRVHVITGDVIGAGTDADVFITFIGSETESGKLSLDIFKYHLSKFPQEFSYFYENFTKKKRFNIIEINTKSTVSPQCFLIAQASFCTRHNYLYLYLYGFQPQNLCRFNCQFVKVITFSL